MAIHDRHLDVHEDQVKCLLTEYRNGLLTIAYDLGLDSQRCQEFFDDELIDIRVLGYEDAQIS